MHKSEPNAIEVFVGPGDCCNGNDCPKVYRTNRNSFIVQGYVLDAAHSKQVKFGANESAVEIPESLIKGIVEKFSQAG